MGKRLRDTQYVKNKLTKIESNKIKPLDFYKKN